MLSTHPSPANRVTGAQETEKGQIRTVLIADEDLGFVWWLGHVLAEAGYQSLPALNCRQAASRIKQMKGNVDAVIMNPRLPGSSNLIRKLDAAKRVKVIAVRDVPNMDFEGILASAVLQKPQGREQILRQEWLKRIRKAFAKAA